MNLQNLVLGIILALSLNVYATTFFGSEDEALSKAHIAYLKKDFKTMALELKNVLMQSSNDLQVKENVFSLLRASSDYRKQEGIPADWRLPDEILKMNVGIRFVQKSEARYLLAIQGDVVKPGLFKQLKLTRFPDQVVLDKQAGIGRWEEQTYADRKPEYGFYSEKSREPVPGGLYILRVELQNGKSVDGWFLIDDGRNSTAAARIAVPSDGETFRTGNPTFHWADFHSPQYQPYERRGLWMAVSRSEPPKYEWDMVWDLWNGSPNISEVTIGKEDEANGVSKLEPGHYIFVLKYSERTRFGDVNISRDSITQRPFMVGQ